MAKEKLFTPEDFDKPTTSKSKWKKVLIIGIIAVIIIGGLIIWAICSSDSDGKTEAITNEEVENSTNITENVSDSVQSLVTQDSEQPTTSQTVEQDIPKIKPETKSEPTQINKPTPEISDDDNEEALKVIRGDYGNIPERKQLLGTRYQQIQSKVNQLKKEGVF